MELGFFGATGTVTGSKYLVTEGQSRILVDCGLFQGFKQLRLRNREPFPVAPDSLEALVLTHAHIDHSGYIPLLVRNGFAGRIHCTPATLDLCRILLPDSGHLQEEEAEYANRRGFSRHHPALPLYTREDAERCLDLFEPVDCGREVRLGGEIRFRFQPAGHILGAASVVLRGRRSSLAFSGDLGRPQDPTMRSPAPCPAADFLVVESTYGNRRHGAEDPVDAFGDYIGRTFRRGGVVLIPAFAVGRAQTVLYCIHRLKAAGKMPDVPVYLDSPMAVDATELFGRYRSEHRLSSAEAEAVCRTARYVNTAEESKGLSASRMPMILISASGMATGGRVLHHLKAFAPDHRNTVLFTGFQAPGTRGAAILGGAEAVKIHGEYVPIRAEVGLVENLSAHADWGEILDWLRQSPKPPLQTFITHGEPEAADALRFRIEHELGWDCRVPEYRETVGLG